MKLGGQDACGPGTASSRVSHNPSVHCSPPSLTFAFPPPAVEPGFWREKPGDCQGAWHPACAGPCLECLRFLSSCRQILCFWVPLQPLLCPSRCQPTLDELLSIIQLIEFQSSQTLCLRWLNVRLLHCDCPHSIMYTSVPLVLFLFTEVETHIVAGFVPPSLNVLWWNCALPRNTFCKRSCNPRRVFL